MTQIPPLEVWAQKFDGDVSVSQYLNERWTANLRGKFLYTRSRHMLNMPGEILSVGGPSSVRAYQPSESSGYQGYFVSGEFRTDLANWETIELPDDMPNIQPYIFIDHMLAHSQYKRARARITGLAMGQVCPSRQSSIFFPLMPIGLNRLMALCMNRKKRPMMTS